MGKPVASRFGQMESKTQYLKISLRNRVYHLHKLVSCTENCGENETKTKLYIKWTDWNFIRGESATKYITSLLGQTDNFWSTSRLVITTDNSRVTLFL